MAQAADDAVSTNTVIAPARTLTRCEKICKGVRSFWRVGDLVRGTNRNSPYGFGFPAFRQEEMAYFGAVEERRLPVVDPA